MLRILLRFGPLLLERADVIAGTIWGPRKLSHRERLAIQLCLARLSRSPIALVTTPTRAWFAGLTDTEIEAAPDGTVDRLDEKCRPAVACAEASAHAKGEMPLDWPDETRGMTMREREDSAVRSLGPRH